MAQIAILKEQLAEFSAGYILFEYSIPRMGKRVDVVLLLHGTIFLLEFKVGDNKYAKHASDQVLDYALDLKNFHDQSHTRPIVPIVVATAAPAVEPAPQSFSDRIYAPLFANRHTLHQVLAHITQMLTEPALDPLVWRDAAYRPTPTIVEAAQALYRGHNVREISRSDAGAINLSLTSEAISEIIRVSKQKSQKAICFVTGVPGAGKTLAGLNIANQHLNPDDDEYSVFLSGNGPLVTVLREALARDEVARATDSGVKTTKKAALSKVSAFIQNIHHFRDDARISGRPPVERVAIFDEAQRAWNLEETAAFMKRKHGVVDFAMSEPEFLISVMDRHLEWAVIVCLIGGGQEIHTGEAGMTAWLNALQARFPHWQVYCSPNLSDEEYLGHTDITVYIDAQHLTVDPRLHLGVSVRSYRAEHVAGLVKAILDVDTARAVQLRQAITALYPMRLTRDLATARAWLRQQARGTERYGLLANSGAQRLRPFGINVKADIEVEHWFLSGKDDVRSAYYLEEVATEFDVQGLELDWAGVVWDGDLRFDGAAWTHHSFKGSSWQRVNDEARRRYLKNAYRVLLTRARQGFVIVVPPGDPDDQTRPPAFYDATFDYLKQIGLEVI